MSVRTPDPGSDPQHPASSRCCPIRPAGRPDRQVRMPSYRSALRAGTPDGPTSCTPARSAQRVGTVQGSGRQARTVGAPRQGHALNLRMHTPVRSRPRPATDAPGRARTDPLRHLHAPLFGWLEGSEGRLPGAGHPVLGFEALFRADVLSGAAKAVRQGVDPHCCTAVRAQQCALSGVCRTCRMRPRTVLLYTRRPAPDEQFVRGRSACRSCVRP